MWLVLTAIAVMSAQTPQSGGAPPRSIESGTQSSVDEPRQAVARTAAEWSALWKGHNFDKPAPQVDFSKEMVVAVFLGSRPTAGYTVRILGTEMRDGALIVRYSEGRPPAGMMTAQVLTSPYAIAAVPKFAGDVKFEKT